MTIRRVGRGCGQALRGLDARHPRHVEVHEHDVGLALEHDLDARRGHRRLAHDLNAMVAEQSDEPAPEQLVVVDDDDPRSVAGAHRPLPPGVGTHAPGAAQRCGRGTRAATSAIIPMNGVDPRSHCPCGPLGMK